MSSDGVLIEKRHERLVSVVQNEVPTVAWYKRLWRLKALEKVEDRPTPSAVYNWRMYMMAFMASAAAVIIGYDVGFIGGTLSLKSFQTEFGLTRGSDHYKAVVANIISVFHAGCFFGAVFSYPASYYFGRRWPLVGASVLLTVGTIVMMTLSRSRGLAPLYAGRVLAGLGVGVSTNLTVVYISEISPPAIRGSLVALYEIGWRIGDLVGFWINYGVDTTISPQWKQWFIPFAIQLIPCALFLSGALFMKELPRWLFQVGRYELAVKNLCWFRQLPVDSDYICYEIKQVEASIEEQKMTVGLGIWDPAREVFTRNTKLLKRLALTVCLFLFQNFLGIQSINYYSPIIFEGLGINGSKSILFSTGMFGVVKFVCTFIYILFIVDSFGRRKAFMTLSTVCSLCFWYIGAYLKIVKPASGADPGPGGKAAIGLMYIWIALFIMAWSGGPFVVGSEVFDQNIRSFVQAINAAMSWVPIFIMSRWTRDMIDAMHFGIYFFFASLALLSIPFVFFFLPETKGIALENMDKLFDSHLPARRAHKVAMAESQQEAGNEFRH